MRDPNRIGPFLRALEAHWRTCPDQRFGQMFANLAGQNDDLSHGGDPWNWEDSQWYRAMEVAHAKAVLNQRRTRTGDGGTQ